MQAQATRLPLVARRKANLRCTRSSSRIGKLRRAAQWRTPETHRKGRRKRRRNDMRRSHRKGILKPDHRGIRRLHRKGMRKPDYKGIRRSHRKGTRKPDHKGARRSQCWDIGKGNRKAARTEATAAAAKGATASNRIFWLMRGWHDLGHNERGPLCCMALMYTSPRR